MAIIRHIEIKNFRSISMLSWYPRDGFNCLVGPGDSGKSSILDAIDLCIGAKRTLQFTDSDFHNLDHDSPISIRITIGALEDSLLGLDSYGQFLRGYDDFSGLISPEPENEQETVLTIQLLVEGDLEPQWSLVSERAAAQGLSRGLSWADRLRLAPTRLGSLADAHLSWRRGSILNKISDERADASKELAEAAREARTAFGEKAKGQLLKSLELVADTAKYLGVPIGNEAKALLDSSSISFSGGTISLHDEFGIPLRGLGLGSTRLLIAGLQRCAASESSIILIDELEHGLEPHRIIRLLHALGAKEEATPLQVFVTTHSPVAVRELGAEQLFVLRKREEGHVVKSPGLTDAIQGTIRKYPEALLAKSVLICEGASEVGLIRGLDQFRVVQGGQSINSFGTALIDGGGDEMFKRARAIQSLGYRVAVLRDSDKLPTPDLEEAFKNDGGVVFCWKGDRALEDELFLSLGDESIDSLISYAVELKDEMLVDAHIKTASGNKLSLDSLEKERAFTGEFSADIRVLLGKASRKQEAKKCWFKSVSAMESVGLDIVGPGLELASADFQKTVAEVFEWTSNGGH